MTFTRLSRQRGFIIVAGCCLWLAVGDQTASASTTSVTVDSTTMVTRGGNPYRYVEATMNGTVTRADASVGTYSVGLVLYFPADDDNNNVGVVDFPNNVYWHVVHPLYGAPTGVPSVKREEFQFQFTQAVTEDYLFQEGYTYASVNWNKVVTDLFGPTVPNDGQPHNRLCYGRIEQGPDAWEILRDAALFLKNPNLVGLVEQPRSVDSVIGTGYSQSGALVNSFMVRGENYNVGGVRPYDAFLVQFQGGVCWQRTTTAPFFGGGAACPGVATPAQRNGAVAMTVASESEMMVRRGYFSRGIGVADYVQYELAGVPHLPKPIFDVSGEFRAVNQIPVDARPIYRAAFRNINQWLHGIAPPTGQYIDGTFNGTSFSINRDADNNATGGVRMPHMVSTVNGLPAGAPLGRYFGTDTTEPANVFRLLAGVFTPFTQAELDARYSTNDIKDRVERAADQLLNDRLILKDDHDGYKNNPHAPDSP